MPIRNLIHKYRIVPKTTPRYIKLTLMKIRVIHEVRMIFNIFVDMTRIL